MGVPEITPVEESNDRPDGSALPALQVGVPEMYCDTNADVGSIAVPTVAATTCVFTGVTLAIPKTSAEVTLPPLEPVAVMV